MRFNAGLIVSDNFDPDAQAYIDAVEASDGQELEGDIRRAITRFVRGCKEDSIWSAIKASCILAGARTLSGALVPLVGSAPTNFNFVSGDYNRITGLKGNGSTKYLNTNRATNADPQNNKHCSIYATNISGDGALLAGKSNPGGLYLDNSGSGFRCRISTSSSTDDKSITVTPGLAGGSRTGSSSGTLRANSTNYSITAASNASDNGTALVFARRNGSTGNAELFSAHTISFYSIGESLNLAFLDTRVSQLMTAISNALS